MFLLTAVSRRAQLPSLVPCRQFGDSAWMAMCGESECIFALNPGACNGGWAAKARVVACLGLKEEWCIYGSAEVAVCIREASDEVGCCNACRGH
jgi:hypothetical protein